MLGGKIEWVNQLCVPHLQQMQIVVCSPGFPNQTACLTALPAACVTVLCRAERKAIGTSCWVSSRGRSTAVPLVRVTEASSRI
jgi:hypothetical protein